MFLQPIDIGVYIWLAIAVASAGYVAVDQFRNNPEAPVMKWARPGPRDHTSTRRCSPHM